MSFINSLPRINSGYFDYDSSEWDLDLKKNYKDLYGNYNVVKYDLETEELEILDTEIIEQTNDSAIVKMHVYNPLGNTIDKIGISYLTTEIIDQTFKDSQSTVTLQVSDPTYFYSKYAINNINSTDYLGYKHTTTYVAGDKYLFIDFYREIKTVADWKSINTYASQNFILIQI